MNPARVRAWIEAARRGLNYLPGEVLVKFKDGVGAEGQTRALQVLGTQQTADTLEWIGAVAVVRDESTPDAYALVDRLRGQPDIEYAEPNFIARTDPGERVDVSTPPPSAPATPRINRGSLSSVITGIPTDSDYASFQWNFQLIGMPNAWDIQPGGSADIIVAVIDTGITASTGNMVYPVWTGSSFQNAVMPYSPNVDCR